MAMQVTKREAEHIEGLRLQAQFDRGYNSAICDLLPSIKPEYAENIRALVRPIHASQLTDDEVKRG